MLKRRLLLPLALAVASALAPTQAWAERSHSDGATTTIGAIHSGSATAAGSAGFNDGGTTADASSRAQPSGPTPLPGSGGVGGDGSGITFRQIPNNAIPAGGVWVDQKGTIHILPGIPADACPQGQTGFYTYDATGAPLGIVCVGNGAGPAAAVPAASPLALAEQASAAQPWPVLRVGASPATGLTGLPSWFWLNGNPEMTDVTAAAGPLTVHVHAAMIDVGWRFGDGATLSTGGIGRPGSGGVQHVYQTDTRDRESGYLVSALMRYQVTYSVNGGPSTFLGIKARSFIATYQVNQLQPQAVSAG